MVYSKELVLVKLLCQYNRAWLYSVVEECDANATDNCATVDFKIKQKPRRMAGVSENIFN
jgi:hypothetical protein